MKCLSQSMETWVWNQHPWKKQAITGSAVPVLEGAHRTAALAKLINTEVRERPISQKKWKVTMEDTWHPYLVHTHTTHTRTHTHAGTCTTCEKNLNRNTKKPLCNKILHMVFLQNIDLKSDLTFSSIIFFLPTFSCLLSYSLALCSFFMYKSLAVTEFDKGYKLYWISRALLSLISHRQVGFKVLLNLLAVSHRVPCIFIR